MELKQCAYCGRTFAQPKRGRDKKYCGRVCQVKGSRKTEAEKREIKKVKERKEKVTNKEIIDINTQALLENLSYGRYVAKYKL